MKQKTKQKCDKCYGFGFWPIGGLSPIGPMDAHDYGRQFPIKCPWCNEGFVDKGPRYEALEKLKLSERRTKSNGKENKKSNKGNK